MPTTPHPTVARELGSSGSRSGSGVDDQLWAQLKPGESLDLRIESLVRDWHESADMLFSIHPLDGSLLVWLVDYLDEYIPGELSTCNDMNEISAVSFRNLKLFGIKSG